jgi:integrase/recombinase XerD
VKLSTAIKYYLRWKDLRGIRFSKGKSVLRALSRTTGDVPLNRVTPRNISNYLDGSRMAADTWWRAYQLLRSFFQFWMARRKIRSLPMPRPRVTLPPPFQPYIFTKTEMRQLLSVAGRSRPNGPIKYDPCTFGTILSFIYGTGALVHEAIELRVSEMELKSNSVVMRRRDGAYKRTLPIAKTLARQLGRYLALTSKRRRGSDLVFLTTEGKKLRHNLVMHNFRRLCLHLGVLQDHGASRTPGLHDLRHTFAVHCLSAWLQSGKEVRQIIPVLSCYMGHKTQVSTEIYLRLVPARFSRQLSALAARGPQNGDRGFTAPVEEPSSTVAPPEFWHSRKSARIA